MSKYAYFMLAAAGAAIAYAIKTIEGKPLNLSLLLIAASVAFWSVSFLLGVRQLSLFREHLATNASCLFEGLTNAEMLKMLDPIEKKSYLASNYQYVFFILGSMSYLFFPHCKRHIPINLFLKNQPA